MQTQRRGALAAVAALLVGVVVAGFVVLASASGPVRPVSDSTLSSSPRPLPTQSVNATPPQQSQPTPALTIPPGRTPGWVLSLWQAVVYLVIAAVVAFVIVVIVRIVRRVRLPHLEAEEPDWERMKTERLAEAVDTGLARIDSGTATDSVIACWVALEQAAASAGVPRDPSETPAEFTVQVLGVGGISEQQLVRLGELYREARYSTHGSSEDARWEARAALLRLREELTAGEAAR
ncbi:DUF4129 domain-containing protein [Kribbella sp. NPDC003557]|uniref:DUF4129 domain-containing protein n=1 Tax=Kribbella sp. NPDC003557 TaxID=3154449 RepID=UPI0033AE93B4